MSNYFAVKINKHDSRVADAAHRTLCLINDLCKRHSERMRVSLIHARGLTKKALADASRMEEE